MYGCQLWTAKVSHGGSIIVGLGFDFVFARTFREAQSMCVLEAGWRARNSDRMLCEMNAISHWQGSERGGGGDDGAGLHRSRTRAFPFTAFRSAILYYSRADGVVAPGGPTPAGVTPIAAAPPWRHGATASSRGVDSQCAQCC